MAQWDQFVLTLDGNAQQLSSVLADPTDTRAQDIGLRTLTLQGGESNANAIFLGNESVTAALYWIRLPAASAGVPGAPLILGEHEAGPMRLSDWFVIGTDGETLHIGTVPY